MPSFSRRDGVFFASFITGPQHVRIGLRFGAANGSPRLVPIPAKTDCDHGPWDEAQIVDAVRAGIDRAVDEGAERIEPVEIHYHGDDSPSYGLVARCAHAIAARLSSGEAFQEI